MSTERAYLTTMCTAMIQAGFRLKSAFDGEDTDTVLDLDEAIDYTEATGVGAINFDAGDNQTASIVAIWGNDPAEIVADMAASSREVLDRVEQVWFRTQAL